MKLTIKSSSGIFMMVPEFLQRSTDRLHLDFGESFPTFSWMKWHHTGFYSLFSLFWVSSGVRACGVGCFVRFLVVLFNFCTCQVGHFDFVHILISHTFESSSKFGKTFVTLIAGRYTLRVNLEWHN